MSEIIKFSGHILSEIIFRGDLRNFSRYLPFVLMQVYQTLLFPPPHKRKVAVWLRDTMELLGQNNHYLHGNLDSTIENEMVSTGLDGCRSIPPAFSFQYL